MDIVQSMYLIMGILIFFSFGAVTLVIAGKDILYAFRRRFSKRGADVFIANNERNINHYFMIPKENKFTVDKNIYITNPKKTMNFTDIDRDRVIDAILHTEERVAKKVAGLTKQKKEVERLLALCSDDRQKFQLEAQIAHFDKIILSTQDLAKVKQENYFFQRKPTFFYIEGDPIPKDFYEWYSALDSKIIDNMISRKLSEPMSKKQESDIAMMKWIIIGAGIAAAVAAFLAIRNNTMIMEICRAQGLSCGLT